MACFVHAPTPEPGCTDCAKEQERLAVLDLAHKYGYRGGDLAAFLKSCIATWSLRWCSYCKCDRTWTAANDDSGDRLCDCCRTPTKSAAELAAKLQEALSEIKEFADEHPCCPPPHCLEET